MDRYPPELSPAEWEEAALVQRMRGFGVAGKTCLIALAAELYSLAELISERPEDWRGDGVAKICHGARVLKLNAAANALIAQIMCSEDNPTNEAQDLVRSALRRSIGEFMAKSRAK